MVAPCNQNHICFEAIESGTFKNSANAVDYSLDEGATWTTLSANTNSPTVSAGDKILWRAMLPQSSGSSVGTFSATGKFNVEGNVMSLLFGDNFKEQTSLSGKSLVFFQLFMNNTKLISAENLLLPATTLAGNCYRDMFRGCSSLTTAPQLPATTLAGSCYQTMFGDCKALTTAPILPATNLERYCYHEMFLRCSLLNYIKAMFTTEPSSIYTYNWVNGVAANGTFVKNSAATWDVSGANGIPNNWTVETAAD